MASVASVQVTSTVLSVDHTLGVWLVLVTSVGSPGGVVSLKNYQLHSPASPSTLPASSEALK